VTVGVSLLWIIAGACLIAAAILADRVTEEIIRRGVPFHLYGVAADLDGAGGAGRCARFVLAPSGVAGAGARRRVARVLVSRPGRGWCRAEQGSRIRHERIHGATTPGWRAGGVAYRS
jgi:hypothetical protein